MNNQSGERESVMGNGYLYRFGQFELDSRKRTLSLAGSMISLTPKAFDVLLFLARNPNRLVTKEELLQAVWGRTFVEEGNLTQYISHLRKALGDNADDARLIVTIARKGYQFTPEVTVAAAADAATSNAAVQTSTTQDSGVVTQSRSHHSPEGTASTAPSRWWTSAMVTAFVLIVAGLGYATWRQLRPTSPAESGRMSLAVLPFQNLTGDSDKEYFADGLTEETISQLSRLSPDQLAVISRTSVMRYKHKDEGLDRIGRDLSVQYVLESSIRGEGDHLRITAQLIQVKDQTHLWSQDYDYPLKDILDIEDDVAKSVAQQIQVHLAPQRQADLARLRPVDPKAFDAYLQGNYYLTHNDEMAQRYYERATQLEPSYAMAWLGLCRARYRLVNSGHLPTEEGYRLAREAAERALALAPNLAEANALMGEFKQNVDFDWAGGDASIQHAVALDPGSSRIMASAALSAAQLGRLDEGLRLARRARELDPLSVRSWMRLGLLHYWAGSFDEAVMEYKRALEIDPGIAAHPYLSEIYVLQGRPQDALAEIEQEAATPYRLQHYSIAYHALGRDKESDAALSELIEKHHAIAAFQIAGAYALRNQPDEAFEWLDRAFAQRDSGLVETKVHPFLKSLRDDGRYVAFLKKLNLPI
jgi:TolB-like protein/DNA-binding winged helix-turn-helix (wHTH) protein